MGQPLITDEVSTRQSRGRSSVAMLDDLRHRLVATFSPSVEELDPVPHGLVEQSRRFAQMAADLMGQGAFDHEALALGWGVSVAAARKRVQRAERRHELFTVSYRDRTFVPAFLLGSGLEPRSEFGPVLACLVPAGDSGFALWAWLTTPTSWLDGAVPVELLEVDPQRVVSAAAARADAAA